VKFNSSIDASLQEWGDSPCFIECNPQGGCEPVSAAELRSRIHERTKQFSRWGMKKGYMVPLVLGNSMDFIDSFFALMNLGAIPVMVKLDYRKLELSEIFHNCKPQAVISEKTHLPILESFLKDILVIERSKRGLRPVQSHSGQLRPTRISDDIATVNYTYRGYGYPLGALVPHDQYLHGAETLQMGLQGNPGEKMLVTLPMSHIFTLVGCIAVPILHKITAVITQTIHPRIIFQLIRDYHIEYLTSVPHIYRLLLRLKEESENLRSLRAFVSGGTLLTAEEYEQIVTGFGVEVLHGYGLTECTPVSRNVRGQAQGGTIGPICDKIDCRIGAPSAAGPGQILIKTPYMSKGYLNRERETREAFDGEWFKTGDRGFFEGDHLIFVEEMKKTRKINGNMVDLEELRKAILLDDQVAQVDIHYENNALFARCRTKKKADAQSKARELTIHLKELLGGYKIPRVLIEES
jgi:long-chain acyl-CoA synthetase